MQTCVLHLILTSMRFVPNSDRKTVQDDALTAARVSKRAVSDLERGINRTARKDTAVLLAGALGLDGRAHALFGSAARGKASTDDVLAALDGRSPGVFAAAARALPNNLPAQLASFIGRGRELADIRALLHGAAQALLDQLGAQREGLDDRYRQASLGQARAAVGDEQAQRAYARGMALSLDQVIDLALGGFLPST